MPLKADQVFRRQQKASDNIREQTRPEQPIIEREPKGSGTKGSGNKKVRRGSPLMPLKVDQALKRQQKRHRTTLENRQGQNRQQSNENQKARAPKAQVTKSSGNKKGR